MSVNFDYIDKCYVEIIITLILISVIFIMIGHKWRDQIQTKLKYPIATIPEHVLDGWSVTHFALFAIFGIIKPGYPLTFLFIGAGWELLEDVLAADKNTQIVDCKGSKDNIIKFLMCNGLQDDYWYGKWDDIVVNLLGYLVGSAVGSWARG